MNAEEFLTKKQIRNDWDFYPPSKIRVIGWLEEYAEAYAEKYHQEKMQNDLSNAYHGGWRRSKKYAKETNFHGLNREQIKEYFQKWYESHYNKN